MADEHEFFKRWTPYTEAIARNILRKQGLPIDDMEEEISNSLLLAGWQVWRDTGDEGLAKHRMSSRANNEAKKLWRERQKRPAKAMSEVATRRVQRRELPGTQESESYHVVGSGGMRNRRAVSRASPSEDMVVQEFIDRLPERQQRVYRFRAAGIGIKEIADELGMSESTVERDVNALKDAFRREFGYGK